jgi:hypothetical protein
VRLQVGGGLDHVERPDHPAHAPAGHGVRLGDAVDDDAPVGQVGHQRGHRREDVVAVRQVLVDLVGDDPDPPVHRPAADRLDLCRRVHDAGGVGWRDEQQGPGAVRNRRVQLVDRDPEAGRLIGGQHHRHAPGQADRLGVRRPERRREQHLVAGIEQGGEGVVDRVLAAVGDQHLRALHVVAGVALGLGRDGLA